MSNRVSSATSPDGARKINTSSTVPITICQTPVSAAAAKRLKNSYAIAPMNAPTAPGTVFSTRDAVERHVIAADLVIGGVLIPGAEAPKLVSRELVSRMKNGSVVVDVAIDQGGCF